MDDYIYIFIHPDTRRITKVQMGKHTFYLYGKKQQKQQAMESQTF